MGKVIDIEGKTLSEEEVKQEPTENISSPEAAIDPAELWIKCDKCGEEALLDSNITGGGLSFIVPATSDNKLMLRCPKCGNSLYLFFKPATHMEIVETEEEGQPVKAEEKVDGESKEENKE